MAVPRTIKVTPHQGDIASAVRVKGWPTYATYDPKLNFLLQERLRAGVKMF